MLALFFDYLKKACCIASNVASEKDEKNIYRNLQESLAESEID